MRSDPQRAAEHAAAIRKEARRVGLETNAEGTKVMPAYYPHIPAVDVTARTPKSLASTAMFLAYKAGLKEGQEQARAAIRAALGIKEAAE